MKEARPKRFHCINDPFARYPGKGKPTGTEDKSVFAEGWIRGEDLATVGERDTFRADARVVHAARGGGYTTPCLLRLIKLRNYEGKFYCLKIIL